MLVTVLPMMLLIYTTESLLCVLPPHEADVTSCSDQKSLVFLGDKLLGYWEQSFSRAVCKWHEKGQFNPNFYLGSLSIWIIFGVMAH